MGLFKDYFHWRSLATLPIGVISILLFIAGLLSRFTEQHAASVMVFAVATSGILVRVLHAAVVSEHSKSNRIAFAVICSLVVIGVAGYVIVATWPHGLVEAPSVAVPSAPSPEGETPSTRAPEKGATPNPTSAADGPPRGATAGGDTRNPPLPGPASPRPAPAPALVVVVSPSGEAIPCEVIPPDRAPNVTLQPGDVVFAAEGGLLRLDGDMKPQVILVSDELADTRDVAVEASGTILVSTKACGGGVILRVDPRTGRQTIVATGFGTPKAILIEASGALLVSDEVGQRPTWGYLWRLNLATGEHKEVHRFAPDEVATGLGIDPNSRDVFFTRRGLYRFAADGVSRMAVEGGLVPTSVTRFRGNLLVSAGGPAVVEITPGGETVSTMAGGGPITDIASTGDRIFVGYGNGRVGKIRLTDREAENVWEGRASNVGVFLDVVPARLH